MELILLEKVTNLGDLGDRVNVRPGYGRNFLVPQNKAVPATKANIEVFEARRAELEAKAKEVLDAAQAMADKLAALGSITIKALAAEEGKLFGSVAVNDIAAALTDAGAETTKQQVSMPDGPIHVIGEHEITIHYHSDVAQVVTVIVEAEAEAEA